MTSENLEPYIIGTTLEGLIYFRYNFTAHTIFKKNKNFLNKKLLSKLKESAYLINTSRGDVLDELYLLKMLEEKKSSEETH